MDAEVERELASVRALFQRELQCFRELTDQRDETRVETMRSALAANEKRLDAIQEMRQLLSEQGGRMVTRDEAEAAINVVSERVEQNRVSIESRVEVVTKPLAERIESNRSSLEARIAALGRPNWTLLISLASVCMVLIGGAWGLTGLKFDASVAPVASMAERTRVEVGLLSERMRIVESSVSGSSQADAASRTDRSQLNERVHSSEDRIANNAAEYRSQIAVIITKLTEVETQFCASDIVRNLMHANDMRIQAQLWAKIFPGENIPTNNAYYPRVCNRAAPPSD